MLFFTLFLVAASATHLTPDNVDETIDGKPVFVKFYAPWCGHCKKMAPAWEKLTEEYDGEGVIVEVNCIEEGKDLCAEHGIKGFPTLKFGDINDLQDYQGGRDFESLHNFAKENLKKICGPTNLDLCDADQKAAIEEIQDLSMEELEEKIAEKTKEIEAAEEVFKTEVENLQAKYEEISAQKDASIDAVKKSGLGLLKSMKAAKKKAEDKDEL